MAFCHAKVHGLAEDGNNDNILDYCRVFSIFRSVAYKGYVSVDYVAPEDPVSMTPAAVRVLPA